MKRYILASDFDGTLSQKDGISKETIKAINKFRQMGNLFGVVTGRDYVNGFKFFKESNQFPFDFIIVSNGASAYDKEGNVYFAEKVNGGLPFGESTLAQELIKQLLQLTLNPCGISFDKTRYDFQPNSDISVLKDVDEFVSSNAFCDTVEHTAEVTDMLKKRFGHYVNPIQNGRCIDITREGVDKSTGIAHLSDCLEIPYENIWTAGDNFNDISMIKKYHGCAMTRGVEGLKKYSEYVCDSVTDVIEIILSK